jgi:peroxiredoxin
MKRFPAIILLVLWSLANAAGPTVISGTAKGKEGRIIRLLTFADQLSYKKVTLASCRISEDGSFSLTTDLAITTHAILDLDFQQVELFLVPGTSYSVMVSAEVTASKDAYYDRPALVISLIREDDGKLNESIGNINSLYNDFLIESGHLVRSQSRNAKVQELVRQMSAQVSPSSDNYLKDYLRYKTASVELFMKVKSREKLAAECLTGQPVLYSNVEYMDFFHLYFEKYMVTNNTYMPYSKTSSLINGTAGFQEILSEMMKDPVLADPCVAGMVLMSGLREMSGMTGFKQPRILELLAEISTGSNYKEQKAIASNLRERILWMKPGSAAPDFELPDLAGGKHSLSDYRGKYLYLSFIDLSSPSSLSEMNLMADIYEKYKDRVSFVSIIAQGLTVGWSQVVKDYRMNWALLKAGDDPGLMEQYGAIALPVFILIDPQGKIYKYPAPSPSEDLNLLLDSF